MVIMHLQLLLVILGLSLVVSEDCISFTSCKKCISSNLLCIWCPDPRQTNDTRPRCESREKFDDKSWCLAVPDNPGSEKAQIPEYTGSEQLQPPLVNIKARAGDTVSFKLVYKPWKNYPIDIYYLFDNSDTMKHYKDDLKAEARNIHSALKKTSNNVRFGVGSFVEKLAEPYASKDHKDKLNTFINHLSLTDNIDLFVSTVEKVTSASNLDNPEASLDALMQAMVCHDKIKWRDGARRIIILSTDDTYHSAGDGKAVGAFLPNDMECHLVANTGSDSSHYYPQNASLRYDYPSVSQISYMAQLKDISIFFIATKNVEKEYKALELAVQGSKYIELEKKTKDKKSTLVETITKNYEELTQSLQIPRPKVLPPHLDLKLSPNCEKKNDQNCKIPHKGHIKINVSLTVNSCPMEDKKYNVIVSPNGMEDQLTISVLAICQCDCESREEKNSITCRPDNANETSRGSLQCGQCKCFDNWYGNNCECNGTSTVEEDSRKCKVSVNDKLCSGRGICSCGECECSDGYVGPQCQYRTDNCPLAEEKVCAGNGKCVNEQCDCYTGWTGNDCSCNNATDMCVGANTEVCSGRGRCKCGACQCTDTTKYSGPFCDQCDTCIEDRCEQLKDYVVCIYNGGRKETDKLACDKKNELKSNIKEVEIKNQTEFNEWSEGNYCENVLDDGSTISYKYYDGNNYTIIWILGEKKLPPVTNIWIPIGSAVGVILLIGILTLIAWKVLVDMMDAREYRKFAEEAQRSGYEVMDNPLYKPAAVSINNPAYEK